MSSITNFFSENATWLFGSGGVAAFLLALLKLWKAKGGSGGTGKPGNTTNRDNTTINTTIKQGAGPVEFGIGVAIIIAAVGGFFWIVGPDQGSGPTTINATNGSAVPQGNNNQTFIINGDVNQ